MESVECLIGLFRKMDVAHNNDTALQEIEYVVNYS